MKILLVSIRSAEKPLEGQKNRSSANFSLNYHPEGTTYLIFETDSKTAHFKVMQDRTAAIDPVIFSDVYNGYQTNDFNELKNLYIANPREVDAPFMVNVYATDNT